MPITINDFDVSDAVIERFFAKMSGNSWSACWNFSALNAKGYGQIDNGFTMLRAHRVSYQLAFGPIPEGKVIDHLCFNTACVNPLHLDPKTPEENNRRRKANFYLKLGAIRLAKAIKPKASQAKHKETKEKFVHFQNSLLDKKSFCSTSRYYLMTKIERVTCPLCLSLYDQAVQNGHVGQANGS